MSDALASDATYLFAPADAYRIRPGSQEGTPLPLDEPQAENPAVGLYIDYYLNGEARAPVVIEILSAGGSVVRRWSSAQPAKAVDPRSVDYTTYWIERHPTPADSAGAHRFVWDFHEESSDGPLVPPGTYTIRLSANGKVETATARVLRDPRIAASNADLLSQYELARRVANLRNEVTAARAKAESLAKAHLSPEQARVLRTQIIGGPLPTNPDDSMGAYSHDFTSLYFLGNALDNLEGAIESADAAPTSDMRLGYERLAAICRQTLTRLDSISAAGL
jgi:uncharacterized small protein (DUF1192 family)